MPIATAMIIPPASLLLICAFCAFLRLLLRMALDALKHRDITQVDWVPERFVRLVAALAFAIREASEINRMLIGAELHRSRGIGGVVNHRVADIAIVADDLARVTNVLTVMTTKTATEVQMADVIRMSLPVGPHFREKIGSKEPLQLGDRCFHVRASFRMHVRVVLRVKLLETRRD
jgi:hypothetical protein